MMLAVLVHQLVQIPVMRRLSHLRAQTPRVLLLIAQQQHVTAGPGLSRPALVSSQPLHV
jgi:hypothetical protein